MRFVMTQRLTLAHGVRGGLEAQAQSLATGLIARGHEVVILTTSHPDGRREGTENGVPIHYISPGTYRRYTTAWWDASYDVLSHMHRDRPFDVLISQSAGSLGYLSQARQELKLPCTVILHCSILGELRTRWRDTRSMRGVYRLFRHFKRLPRFWLRWRSMAYAVQRWIAISHEIEIDLHRELGIPTDRILFIPNGIDTSRFHPDPQARQAIRAQLGLADSVPLLVAIGRIEYEKGFHIAIEAGKQLLARFPDMRLLIIGDGVYRPALERMAAPLGNAVIFQGYVPNNEIPPFLAAADLFLMPTLRDEGLPLSIIEALATGLPVIASKSGGNPSAVDQGKTGFLVPLGDANALAQATEKLLSNQGLHYTMSNQARQIALQRFSLQRVIDSYEQALIAIAKRQWQ